jgi:PAS domain S-box-containing protein/putative nucleotidyltransferase with HDIG domain
MNRQNRRFFIAIGFYLSLAIMVGIGIFSFMSTRDLVRYNQLLNRSMKVNEVLDELRAFVIQAESGQRGYILTGSDRFLASYRKEASAIPSKFKELRNLTEEHPQSQQLLDALEPLISQKLAILQENIALFDRGNHEAAIQSIKSEAGLKVTSKISLTIVDLEKEESKVLAARQAGAEKMRRRALFARLIGAPISFGMLILIFYCLKREIAMRRHTEEALRLSESRYRNIFDNAVEGIFQSTPQGRFISVNPSVAEMHGYGSPEELLEAITDIEHQVYVNPGRRRDFQRLIEQDGFVRNFEYQAYRKDGNILWISENTRGVHDAAGNLSYYEGFAENITARKCAEIKLHRANRGLKTLSAVNHALIVANVEYTFLQDICKIITEVGGYRLAWVAMAHHDATKAVSVLAHAGVEAGYLKDLSLSWADDEKGRGPTGTAIRTSRTTIVKDVVSDPNFAPWREKILTHGLASVISLPLPLDNVPWSALTIYAPEVNAFDPDEVVMLEELAQDIQYGIISLRAQKTRQRTETALRESEEKFRGLFETSPDVIGQVDLDLNFLMLNHMAERLFGYERVTQLIGTKFLDLVDPTDHPRVIKGTRKLLETGTLLNAEYTFVRKDGISFPGELSAVLTVDAAGTPKAFTGTIRDITERKRMQEKLEEERNRLFAILEGLPVYVYLQASDRSLRFVNRLFREHFGDPENRPCYVTMHGREEPCEVCPAMRVLETGLPEESEWTAANGRSYHLYDYPYKDIDGSSLVMEIGMDITERKKAEESLKESYERLQASLAGTVTALSAVVESKDPYTAGHQQRVTHLACAIAREMSLSQDMVEGIGVIGYLHDIGKIAVPAEILSRPGKINEFEFNLIKQHPVSGFDILKQIAFPWPVAEAVFQHHERLDGSGYPSGLTDEHIILEARVLAVADVVEAMASHRPYRPAVGIELALEEIAQNKGKLYDPEVVEACVRLFNEKGYEFV